jgi:hypothetical protein
MRFLSYLVTTVVALLAFGCVAIHTLLNNGMRLGFGAAIGLLAFLLVTPPIGAIALAGAGVAGSLTAILSEPHVAPGKQGALAGTVNVASSLLWVAMLVFVLMWVFGHHVNPLRILGWIRRAALAVKRAADVTEKK